MIGIRKISVNLIIVIVKVRLNDFRSNDRTIMMKSFTFVRREKMKGDKVLIIFPD